MSSAIVHKHDVRIRVIDTKNKLEVIQHFHISRKDDIHRSINKEENFTIPKGHKAHELIRYSLERNKREPGRLEVIPARVIRLPNRDLAWIKPHYAFIRQPDGDIRAERVYESEDDQASSSHMPSPAKKSLEAVMEKYGSSSQTTPQGLATVAEEPEDRSADVDSDAESVVTVVPIDPKAKGKGKERAS